MQNEKDLDDYLTNLAGKYGKGVDVPTNIKGAPPQDGPESGEWKAQEQKNARMQSLLSDMARIKKDEIDKSAAYEIDKLKTILTEYDGYYKNNFLSAEEYYTLKRTLSDSEYETEKKKLADEMRVVS